MPQPVPGSCVELCDWVCAFCVCAAENTLSPLSLSLSQANSPLAASTTGAARTCVCSLTKATSTAPAEGAASYRRTSPAGVRQGGREGGGAGSLGTPWGPSPSSPAPEAFSRRREKLRMTS